MSVKRIVLLCVVPDIKETYENVKILFNLIKIKNISFKFVADFKLLLIINGQQTASAMFPCPYCFVSLKDLKEPDTLEQVETNDAVAQGSSSGADNLQNHNPMTLKTYGDLKNDFEKFASTGKNLKYSKLCNSTVNPPLFEESEITTVLEKCVIPELHILMGFVNHYFWKGLVPLLGRDKALQWPKKLNLIAKAYHGECFEGNACRKLLKHADMLNDEEFYKEVGFFKIVPFINVFNSMNKVVDYCFTNHKVGPDLDQLLEKVYKDLDAITCIKDLSITLNIHVLKPHLKECLQFIENNNGLRL